MRFRAALVACALALAAVTGAAADAPTPVVTADVRDLHRSTVPVFSVNDGRPTIASADGKTSVALRGVIQLDAARYRQDSGGNPNLNSGASFRRARLGVDGTVDGVWNYNITAEFAGTGAPSTQLNAAYVEYAGWKPLGLQGPVRVRIGAFTPPTGLEDATSSNHALFAERPAPADLVRGIAGGDGRYGLAAYANGGRWFAAGVVTGSRIGATGDYDEEVGYVARAAYLASSGPDHGIHVGANFNGVIAPPDRAAGPGRGNNVRLRERPELRVDDTRLVDTGGLAADGVDAYGLEFGLRYKSLYLAGEHHTIEVDRAAPGADLTFDGWYVQGSWIFTGESRRWSASSGGFGAVRPSQPLDFAKKQYGAWELTGRFSTLNLNDNEGRAGFATPAGGVRGGVQEITTLGLNWFPNNVVRFQVQAQDVRIDRLDPGTVGLATVGAQIGQQFQTINLRSQIAF